MCPDSVKPCATGHETRSCVLSIIDTTCDLTVPANTLVEPAITGHELLDLPTFAFLIKHEESGRQVLFDLGCRKDYWNLPTPTAQTIDLKVPGIRVKKDMADILIDGGVDIEAIEAAIISHHHYDHFGNPASFPESMKLVVGPGFSEHFLPGYPKAAASPAFGDAFEGRTVEELKFSDENLMLGFRACDYFHDGSLYILETPGHAIGHISALVRTTNHSSVLLGGDVCHFPGVLRPTPNIPMPESISEGELRSQGDTKKIILTRDYTCCHPVSSGAPSYPFYKPCSSADSWYIKPVDARKTIEKLQLADQRDSILLLLAHDRGLLDEAIFFPNATLNNWQADGLKRRLRWRFLYDLPVNGKSREHLVNGTYIDGKLCRTLSGKRPSRSGVDG